MVQNNSIQQCATALKGAIRKRCTECMTFLRFVVDSS